MCKSTTTIEFKIDGQPFVGQVLLGAAAGGSYEHVVARHEMCDYGQLFAVVTVAGVEKVFPVSEGIYYRLWRLHRDGVIRIKHLVTAHLPVQSFEYERTWMFGRTLLGCMDEVHSYLGRSYVRVAGLVKPHEELFAVVKVGGDTEIWTIDDLSFTSLLYLHDNKHATVEYFMAAPRIVKPEEVEPTDYSMDELTTVAKS